MSREIEAQEQSCNRQALAVVSHCTANNLDVSQYLHLEPGKISSLSSTLVTELTGLHHKTRSSSPSCELRKMHAHAHARTRTDRHSVSPEATRTKVNKIYKAVGGFGYFYVYTALRMFALAKGEGIVSTARLCNIRYLGSRAGPSIWVLALCLSLLSR